MNRIITAEMFVFLMIGGAIMAASLYLDGSLTEAIESIRNFVRHGAL